MKLYQNSKPACGAVEFEIPMLAIQKYGCGA